MLNKKCTFCREEVSVDPAQTIQNEDGFYYTHTCGSTLFWPRDGAEIYRVSTDVAESLKSKGYRVGRTRLDLDPETGALQSSNKVLTVYDNSGKTYTVTIKGGAQ